MLNHRSSAWLRVIERSIKASQFHWNLRSKTRLWNQLRRGSEINSKRVQSFRLKVNSKYFTTKGGFNSSLSTAGDTWLPRMTCQSRSRVCRQNLIPRQQVLRIGADFSGFERLFAIILWTSPPTDSSRFGASDSESENPSTDDLAKMILWVNLEN